MNNTKYLDLNGLNTLVSIIKTDYAKKNDLQNVSNIANGAASVAANLTAEVTNINSNINNISSNLTNTEANVSNIANNLTNTNANVSNIANNLNANYYNKTEVNELVSGIDKLVYNIVNNISEVTNNSTIYLVPKENSASGNVYDEYMLINSNPELIGSTEVNLTNYVQFSDLNFANTTDIDNLFATGNE